MNFRIESLQPHDSGPRLAVFGECDIATAEELRARLEGFAQSTTGTVIVDCAGISFMDSTAIDVVLRLHLSLEGRGRRLVLVNVPDQMARMLNVAGLDQVMHLDR